MPVHPIDYPRVRYVHSLDELVSTAMTDGINALCWLRTLEGDFAEIIKHLTVERGITTLDAESLRALPLSAAGKTALECMLSDQQQLQQYGFDPVLDCIHGYVGHEPHSILRTDVCSFHADSATAEAATFLCTYVGASSIGVWNEDVIPRALVPTTRAILLDEFGGNDDDDFLEYLTENFHDLHYTPIAHARTYEFGIGNLWRIAIDYPGNPVPPCIHRAPDPIEGEPPRLILIG